jgi:transcription elongation factor Elf1
MNRYTAVYKMGIDWWHESEFNTCSCCGKEGVIQCTIHKDGQIIQRWCKKCNLLYTFLGWLEF